MKTSQNRSARISSRARAAQPASKAVSTWSLTLVDSRPIRQKAEREYRKAVRALEIAKAESERFHSEDQPAYSQWLNANFGGLLTELRELQTKLFEAQNLVNEVQQEYHFGDHPSISSAYKQVLHRRAHPEEAEEDEEEEEELDPEDEELLKEFQEAMGGDAEFWQKLGMAEPAAKNGGQRAGGDRRLKDIYRKLARRLHPDNRENLTAAEKELWHRTQEAYQAGNLDELEVILSHVELADEGSKSATISTLMQLTAGFKKSLRMLKRQLASIRQDVAWNFSRLADRRQVFHRAELSLRADRTKLLWLLSRYQAQITRWDAMAKAPARRARKKSRSTWMDEELF